MEFFIKKGATLPLLKLNIIDNGRNDYDSFLNTIELSSLFFSMTNVDTGIPKIINKPAGVGVYNSPIISGVSQYYIYYQFQNTDTIREGRFEGEFILKNSDGVLVITLGEKLFINITDSFITDDIGYSSCYVIDYACCNNPDPSVVISPTPTPTSTVTPTTTQTLTPTPTITASITPSITITNTVTPTKTLTPTPTPTPSRTPIFGVNINLLDEVSGVSDFVKILYSTDSGSTWSFFTNGNGGYPNYNSYGGLSFYGNTTIYFAITDLSDNNLTYGQGLNSGDYTSLCGTITPYILNSISANTEVYINLNVSGGSYVVCPPSIVLSLGFDSLDAAVACGNYYTTPSNYYVPSSQGSTLHIGDKIYTGSSLTTLSSLGFYSDGTFYYEYCDNAGNIEICFSGSCG